MAKRTGGFIGQDGINAPDPATGVTGTAGNEQVTVSWTAPSDVGGAAITGYSVQSADGSGTYLSSYDIENASYDSKDFGFSSQDANLSDVIFNDDGTKMWMVGTSSDSVHQYSLSTAYDVSTGSYDSVSFSVASQETSPQSLAFNDDGTKMYVTGFATDAVYQYSLSTAYDVSTASYDSVSLDVSSQDTAPQKILWNPSGTKLYMLGYSSDKISQYNLTTAYDLSTASFSVSSPSFATETTVPTGMAFKPDGTKLFVGGFSPAKVFQYSLSTAYDLTTISYDNISFSYTEESDNRVVMFNNVGTFLYVAGPNSDKIHQYTSGLSDYPTASPVTVRGLTNGTSYTFNVWAINPFGWSSPSDASGGVSPVDASNRGLFMGGENINTIQWIQITTLGDAEDFGDLTTISGNGGAVGSSTRAVRGGGYGSSTYQNTIDYVEFDSTGNATDFGDLNPVAGNGVGSCSSSTRGIFAGGSRPQVNVEIQYITIASTGNSSDFGDLVQATDNINGGMSNGTRGICAYGGYNSGSLNTIQYVTIASTGNASDFGDSTTAAFIYGCASNSTRGLAADNTTIEYVTIASTGNATDFGDLATSRGDCTAVANATRCVFTGSGSNDTDYVTIATTGNSSDFGNLIATGQKSMAISNAHGGLS